MLLRLTKISFLFLIFSLAFMQPSQHLFGLAVQITDLIFLITFSLWTLSIIFKKTSFHWHKFFWLIILYFSAILFSALFSENIQRSLVKALGELYLLSLPILTFNLVQTNQFAKRVFQTWLGATSVSIIVGLLTILLFYVHRENWLLNYTLFHFGTLPPGNYPRLQSTFVNANMLCNYLSVSLVFALISNKIDWISKPFFYFIFGGIFICSAFTISPGLGGIGLLLGIWYWIHLKKKNGLIAKTSLITGIFIAVMFLFSMVISPNLYPTAPYYFDIPIIEKRIEPSVRVLTWTGATQTFIKNPVFGVGIGQDSCNVEYLDLSGINQHLNDAHNLYLNILAQVGILGFLAILGIIIYLTKTIIPITLDNDKRNVYRIGLAIAFICGFIYQGFGGSFEDTRHLWVLIGLMLTTESVN